MGQSKKWLRMLALVVFMVLASVGMSITGAAPTLAKNRERYFAETEQVEKRENDESENPEKE
jgi:hypothetical protein